MATYLAHYKSPAAADVRGSGYFEFESDARAGTRDNARAARMRMLELFGKDAVSWQIDSVERQRQQTRQSALDGQLELDFRPEKKKRRRRTKEYW